MVFFEEVYVVVDYFGGVRMVEQVVDDVVMDYVGCCVQGFWFFYWFVFVVEIIEVVGWVDGIEVEEIEQVDCFGCQLVVMELFFLLVVVEFCGYDFFFCEMMVVVIYVGNSGLI